MSIRIALTGGTGFLGRYVVRAAVRHGHTVRLLARRRPVHPQLADLRFEAAPGDIGDPAAVASWIEGADAVIHAAASTKARTARGYAGDVTGTAIVARAAAARRLPMVFVSSIVAREPGLSPYARSKRAAEQVACACFAAGGTLTIARPTAIYGPWDHDTLEVFKLIRPGRSFVPGSRDARVTLIHAADAAEAILALAVSGRSCGTVELCDARPNGYSWSEIVEAAACALGWQSEPRYIPPLAVRGLAFANGIRGLVARKAVAFGPGKARELLHRDWRSSLAAQPSRRMWSPRISIAAGFDDAVRWYRACGLLS